MSVRSKEHTLKQFRLLSLAAFVAVTVFASALPAAAITNVIIVRESSVAGSGQPTSPIPGAWYKRYEAGVAWNATSNLTDGAVYFVNGPGSAPLGTGSLALKTTEPGPTATSLGGKATFFNYDRVGVRLSTIESVSFSSYTTISPVAASFQMEIFRNGTTGFSTVNVEPYLNAGVSPTNNVWQQYSAGVGLAGKVWLTGIGSGEGSQNLPVTWDRMMQMFPNATVVGGIGFNLGRATIVGVVNADALSISSGGNTVVYNFENAVTLLDKNACKDGGWKLSTAPVFKNQGDCVSFFASKDKDRGKNHDEDEGDDTN